MDAYLQETLDSGELRPCDRPEGAAGAVEVAPEGELPLERASVAPGAVVGRYRVVAKIGEGAQGHVYRGEHMLLGYPVAIKVLAHTSKQHPSAELRLRREARVGAVVRHRNLASVLEAGRTPEGEVYLVMEYVEGTPLKDLIGDGMPTRAVVEVGMQLGAGLSALEHRGVVHRDVKPDNVHVERTVDGSTLVRLMDFGLAKSPTDDAAMRVTKEGSVLGTPYYMSPEQLRDDPLDSRSDLYSLGALLFECVTGRPPFDEPTLAAVLAALAVHPAPKVRDIAPECDRRLAEIIDRALMRKPDDRFESPREMTDALRALAATLDSTGTPAGWTQCFEASQLPEGQRAPRSGISRRRPSRVSLVLRSGRGRAGVALAACALVGIGIAAVTGIPGRSSAEGPVAIAKAQPADGLAETPSDDGSLDVLERSARGLFLRGEAEAALNLYRQVTDRAPTRPSAWRGRGLVAASLGREPEARRALRQYLTLDPAAEDRADVLRELDELDEL